jgi:outer membrane protein TolC
MRKAYEWLDTNNLIPGMAPCKCVILVIVASIFSTAKAQDNRSTETTDQGRPTVSLTLPKAIEMAMLHNRQLKLAHLSVAENETKQSIAHSSYYPHLNNLSTATYLTELQGVDIPAGAFGNSIATGPIPGQSLRIGQGSLNAYTSGTGLTQPLTQMFKIHNGERVAAADLRIAQIDETDAENSISLLVHQMYFDILTSQAKLDAAKQAVSAAAISEEESQRAVSEGKSLDVAMLQAHAASLDQQQAVLTQQLAIDDAMLQFDDVLGLPLGTRLILDDDALGAPPILPSRSEAITSANANSPKVLAARQTVEKAKAAVSLAHDAYIPDFSGFARYSYQSGVPFLVHNFGTFGGVFTYDLFDGGEREAKLKQAKIQLQMAETQLQQMESDVAIEIASAYDKVEQLQHLVSVVDEALKTRVEAARISVIRVEQNAELASGAARDNAAVSNTRASLLEAKLGLFLAQNKIQQILGQRP